MEPFFQKKTFWGGPSFSGIYGTDKNGVLLEGIQRGSDGHLHYFQPEVKSVDKPTWKEIDGKRYRLTKIISNRKICWYVHHYYHY